MIRILSQMKARPAGSASLPQALPMIPASGTVRIDFEDTDAGGTVKKTLTARLDSSASSMKNLLYGDIVLILEFSDGTVIMMGTDDIPVRLKVSEGDSLDIAAEYISGA